ncbi:MAG: glycosyltransferase family 4 protein [Candidatus Saccharibacteria bacterium]|nr:glycosyltransferase family 4 protein [Candidatus Saccharibacteria bacterium]
MIEMTGDIHNALRQHPNLLKRIYAPILYRQIKNSIKNCQFGLYVSQKYLQEQFPIAGEMCGCSDVVLDKSDESILEKRIKKIDQLENQEIVNIALIGFYQGRMKGVDTAIRALSHLPKKFHLSILGNGTQISRDMWYKYAAEYGVGKDRIHFPKPLSSAKLVLEWLDTMDFFVLPTRSEGFGRCIAEAMSRGCVCFATNICTIPELLPQECCFELDKDEEIANLLTAFSSDSEKMKAMARRNFEEAKKYDFDLLRNKRNVFLDKFKSYCVQKQRM